MTPRIITLVTSSCAFDIVGACYNDGFGFICQVVGVVLSGFFYFSVKQPCRISES